MSMRTPTIALLVGVLGFGSAFGVSRFGVHDESAAAAARPVAFDVPAELRAGKIALPADAPPLVPRRIVPRPAPAPPPPPPRPAPVRRAPAPPAPPPPAPREARPATAPQTTPSQPSTRQRQTTAPAQAAPPPRQAPVQRRAAPAPAPVTIIGGD
jgi:hypothetical protein